MPAISPARLQRDLDALFETVADLDVFERGLEKLLESYADRTVRPARSGRPASLVPSLYVPRPVLRKLDTGMASVATEAPEWAFSMAERLWDREEMEYKRLGLKLLNAIPDTHSAEVLETLMRWLPEIRDETLLELLFNIGTRVDQPAVLALVETELEGDGSAQALALDHLQAIIGSAGDDTLPGIFRLLRRVLDQSRFAGSARLLMLVKSLAARVPVETAYFLRQQYLVALRPEYGRLIRQSMAAFPEHVQADLRRVLRENPLD